eukprot:06725.XXX_71278_71929_1 [CDS] Oithona nana genome sequencing.
MFAAGFLFKNDEDVCRLGKPKCTVLIPNCEDNVRIEDFGTIPYFLMIGGIMLGFSMVVRIISYATPFISVATNDCVAVSVVLANHSPWEWRAGSVWTLLSDFINLVVFAWGTVAVFLNYSDWKHDESEKENDAYCHYALFMSSMILVCGYWGLTALLSVAKCAYVVKSRRRSMAF